MFRRSTLLGVSVLTISLGAGRSATPQPFRGPPPGPLPTVVSTPVLAQLGNHGCAAGDAACFQNEASGKLEVGSTWALDKLGFSGPQPGYFERITHFGVYRYVSTPVNDPHPHAPPPQDVIDAPVATAAAVLQSPGRPPGVGVAYVPPVYGAVTYLDKSQFKQGDCFVVRAFAGPVASSSARSNISAPQCVDANVGLGTTSGEYQVCTDKPGCTFATANGASFFPGLPPPSAVVRAIIVCDVCNPRLARPISVAPNASVLLTGAHVPQPAVRVDDIPYVRRPKIFTTELVLSRTP
jgi:hypothetical protein